MLSADIEQPESRRHEALKRNEAILPKPTPLQFQQYAASDDPELHLADYGCSS